MLDDIYNSQTTAAPPVCMSTVFTLGKALYPTGELSHPGLADSQIALDFPRKGSGGAVMADHLVIDASAARNAIEALVPVLADLTEATAMAASSGDVVTQAAKLADLCRDAALVADTVALVARRSSPEISEL